MTVGLVTGLIVALIEEFFFRGMLFAAVRRESGTASAIILPSLLYAALHFLSGRLRLPADQIEWSSGWAVLERMFIQYAQPLTIADSFLALFVVGVSLALVRLYTGAIAVCIGLHAAWVCMIFFVQKTTSINPEHPAGWLVGTYDGVIGWAAVIWSGVMVLIYTLAARGRYNRNVSGAADVAH